ncbi:MAG: TadA family conjugal transfer-associated ATPase [Jatrophihabitantaceae bacterium]
MSAPFVDRVRARLASGGTAEAADFDAVLRAESTGIADDAVFAALREQVAAELTGAGPLEALLELPGVTDVLVTAPDAVWVDRGAGIERTSVRFADEAAVRRLAQRLMAASGRRLDDAVPFADVALSDGTRLHAMLPPLVPSTTLSLRVLARTRFTLDDLGRAGSMPLDVAGLLRAVVAARMAFVLSGGTGTGKTTLLGALMGEASAAERLLVIEDARELVVAHPHVVRLMTRAANVEGAGEVGLRDLVRQALRMRPDRIVVGEFRGPEMVELLIALNTGHEGGAATVHANSAGDVPGRLAVLGSLGGLQPTVVTDLVASAVDVVVHLGRGPSGARRVSEIGLLERAGSELVVSPVWTYGRGAGAAAPRLARGFETRGAEVPELLRGERV